MIRPELLHPLFSHFPIAFLGVYPLLFLASFKWKELALFARIALFAGVAGMFISIYLGDMALERLMSSICNLPLVYDHESKAYNLLYFSLLLGGIDLVIQFRKMLILKIIQTSFSICILYFLFQTGHSGSDLVYENGVAVKVAKECQER
ncbi:MAG: hypothetical protein Fur0010_16950 [Bdellovibrio sp.]